MFVFDEMRLELSIRARRKSPVAGTREGATDLVAETQTPHRGLFGEAFMLCDRGSVLPLKHARGGRVSWMVAQHTEEGTIPSPQDDSMGTLGLFKGKSRPSI
jgi:hypothetical protein